MTPTSLLDMLSPVNWPLFALVSARIGGMMLVAPLWSTGVVPMRVRAAVAIALTAVLAPLVGRSTAPDIAVPSILVPMVTEAVIGLAIGLVAAVLMYALGIAAEVVSLQMGLSLGPALGGPSDAGTPGIGQLYHQLFLVIYVSTGGPIGVVQAIADSFGVIPVGGAISFERGGPALVMLGGTVFSTAIQVVAPVMVALLVTNLALAVVNRAIPQLNTMMVAVPVTVAVGLIALGGALPLTASLMGRWAGGIPASAAGVVQSLVPQGVR